MTACPCGRAPRCYKSYTWCPPGPEGPRTGMSAAESDDLENLACGRPVPGHFGACANPECAHALLRHDRPRGTSPRPGAPCKIPGCRCPGLARHTLTRLDLIQSPPLPAEEAS